ncbi:hypothetical protein CDAR_466011 [Caerostris darwini]|uniref:Uncharacterized protein n=1 Tax=Caerostris darwini TaxID=1538125 RepID=A0AAV4WN79_9ARAC|nr:hypothetical protein CDAR_466011 [Caerostris darwini]
MHNIILIKNAIYLKVFLKSLVQSIVSQLQPFTVAKSDKQPKVNTHLSAKNFHLNTLLVSTTRNSVYSSFSGPNNSSLHITGFFTTNWGSSYFALPCHHPGKEQADFLIS